MSRIRRRRHVPTYTVPTPLYNYRDPYPAWTISATTTSSYVMVEPWPSWIASSQTIVTGAQSIWLDWNRSTTLSGCTFTNQPPRVETPEEIAAREHAAAEAATERTAAVARARTLLDTVLSAEQRAELERTGSFHVVGSCGRRYRIGTNGQAGNVHLDDPRHRPARFCCHPRDRVPDPDAWIAQMLAIEHDEDGFLRTANLSDGQYPADFRLAAA